MIACSIVVVSCIYWSSFQYLHTGFYPWRKKQLKMTRTLWIYGLPASCGLKRILFREMMELLDRTGPNACRCHRRQNPSDYGSNCVPSGFRGHLNFTSESPSTGVSWMWPHPIGGYDGERSSSESLKVETQ